MGPEKRTPIKCAACGAKFHLTCARERWGYAYKGRLVCSYHCMRALEAGNKKQKSERTPTRCGDDARRRSAWELHEAGKTWREIADILGYMTWESASSSGYKYRQEMLERQAEQIAEIESGTEAVG